MKYYRFTLDPKSKQHICPDCGEKRYVRYVDLETGEYLPLKFGRCNRESNCTWHVNPYTDGYAKEIENGIDSWSHNSNDSFKSKFVTKLKEKLARPTSYIEPYYIGQTMNGYNRNAFVQFLRRKFGENCADNLIEKYRIGTSKQFNYSTVFWQIDNTGKVRSGKLLKYDEETGKRIKNRITWVHKILFKQKFNLNQCFFGEHLLAISTKPIGIVESEKTAIIASAYLPQLEWIATGGKGQLNPAKCSPLKGKTVTLFPDLKAYDEWQKKQKEIQKAHPDIKFTKVSSLLEERATEEERNEGLDLADYLLRFELSDFLNTTDYSKPSEIQPKSDNVVQEIRQRNTPETEKSREKEVDVLRSFFDSITLSNEPIRLDAHTVINNQNEFVAVSLLRASVNNGNSSTQGCITRLTLLKEILQKNSDKTST